MMDWTARRRLPIAAFLCGFAWGGAHSSPATAQVVHDFATRTPGADAFAYEGESPDLVPPAPTLPSTTLTGGELAAVASPGGGVASYSVSGNGRYAHHRFVFVLDAPEATVQRIDLRWDGWSINLHGPRTSGAALLVWNWAAGTYQVLDSSPSATRTSLAGVLTGNVVDYLGGPGENELVILVSSNDKRTGNRPLWLSTDYVSATVTALPQVDRFEVIHDRAGIHCLPEAVSVSAVALDGTPVPDYAGTVILDTGTGAGSWLPGPGLRGTLADATPGDGVATYTFADADDGTAAFLLHYRSGAPSVDVDVTDASIPTITDDDLEGLLVFAPSGFTVTASALPNPPPNPIADPIGTQTAAVPFALHLTAYGQTPTDPTCGVIESYDGARSLLFWSTAVDPAGPVLAVSVEGTPVGTAEVSATPVAVAFSAGQAQVLVRYDDVGRIRIGAKDVSPAEPVAGIRGETNLFVVRPADLQVVEVTRTDGTPNPGAATPAGAVFVAAGRPFRAVVRAIDAEGDPTPSYGREAAPEGIRLEASALVAPAGGRNGSADDGALIAGTAFSPTAAAGTFEATNLAWDEVGSVRLRARVGDGSYLGTGDVLGTETGVVGRFVPDHFTVVQDVPVLETACPAGGFTYVGQGFRFVPGSEPRLEATARAAAGTVTSNYDGVWMRMSAADLTDLALSDSSGTLEPAVPALPTVTSLGGGRVQILFDSGPALRFARSTPVQPWDAEVELSFDVRDADGVLHPGNPVRIGGTAAGTGIAWSAGAAQRFGRLQFENAYGSELQDLPVPFHAALFDGLSFQPHAPDSCTTVAIAALSLTPDPAGLPTSASIAHSPFLAGEAGLSLSAPGAGRTGDVDLLADLTLLPWLRGDWDGDGIWDEDPTGRATFGIHEGDDAVIYVRERY